MDKTAADKNNSKIRLDDAQETKSLNALEPTLETQGSGPTSTVVARRKTVSRRQLIANRANGRRSRGPVTTEGKRISSQNSLKTGIYSKNVLIRGENARELADLARAAYEEWQPKTVEEKLLVERIIASAWRFRRVLSFERVVHGDILFVGNDKDRTGHVTSLFRDDFFERFSRYEGFTVRQLEKTLKQLRKLRDVRLSEGADA